MEALAVLLGVILTSNSFQRTDSWSLVTSRSEGSCGGYMTDWMGEFFSPHYPNNYPNNAQCTWTIHSPGNSNVLLTFTYADLETCCDYIKVFDGPTSHYPSLGILQENRIQYFNSTENDLTVVFYSDPSVTRKGFRANWVFVDSNLQSATTDSGSATTDSGSATTDSGSATNDSWSATNNSWPSFTSRSTGSCGGYMTDWMGEFFSPHYPNNYPNNARCTWTIHSPGNSNVLLTFTYVDLETCCDNIKVFDGPTSHYPSLGILQGNRTQSFNSTQNDLTVVFYSDSSVTRKGFRANWVFVDSNSCRYYCGYSFDNCSCDSNCQYNRNCCHDYISSCLMTTDSSYVSVTPRTDVNYSCQYNCGTDFGYCSCNSYCQYYGNCCTDFQFYCPVPTILPDITTENYPKCGGHLYGSGQFSSPNYPYVYTRNNICVWYLSAQPGQRIFLSFLDVQLERCCNCDYISVHDGSSDRHRELGRVCFNDTTDWTFQSSSQYMTVVFRSDFSGVSRGFKALFTSSLTADQGHVDCSSDNMTIGIRRSYLNSLDINENNLYVDDHRCRPSITRSEVVFRFPLDTCGTGREMMNGYVTYTNNLHSSQSQSGEITRQSHFLLRVACRMEPDTIVQILYKTKENVNANIMGTGHFNANMAFYTSKRFSQKIYDSTYEVKLNQIMYVQVQLNRPDSSLDLFLDTCVASPDPKDFKTHSYDLLRNGCARDRTFFSYINGQQYYARFHFQAFKFLQTHSSVYLQCKVIICPDSDHNSRCRQGCRYRYKRSLESKHHTNTVILGPIKLKGGRLKQSEKRKE